LVPAPATGWLLVLSADLDEIRAGRGMTVALEQSSQARQGTPKAREDL
jgi:hypothetical protein